MKYLMVGLILLAIMSCSLEEKEVVDPTANYSDDAAKALKILEEDGFNMHKAKIINGYLILEGDILVEIQHLLDNEEFDKEQPQMKQNLVAKRSKTGGKISDRYAKNVKISIASDMPPEWKSALQTAISRFNEINETKIKFSLVNKDSHTHISFKDIGARTAFGEYPQKKRRRLKYYRRPGPNIFINPNRISNLTSTQRIGLLMHEIGHTIGFEHVFRNKAHKDQFLADGNIFDGSRITGTAEFDASSIMLPTQVPNRRTFSYNDKIALQKVYPGPFESDFSVPIYGPSFVAVNQTVTFSTNAGVGTYRWEVQYKESNYWSYLGNSSVLTFKVPFQASPSGISTMKIRCTVTKSGKEGRNQRNITVEGG